MTPLASALSLIAYSDAAFSDLLQEIYASGYTGSVLLHCVNGIPSVVEFPARQVRLQLTRLDKPPRTRDAPEV